MNENHVKEVANKSGQFNVLYNQVLHCVCKKKKSIAFNKVVIIVEKY